MVAIVVLGLIAGCSSSSAGDTLSTQPAPSELQTTQPEAPPSTSGSPPSTTSEPTIEPSPTTTSAVDATAEASCDTAEPLPALRGESGDVVEVGTFDGVTVSVALYPLPDNRGAPWSQWGQGIVLPSGRFVSAVGDHLGLNGNSWFYEYDPASGELTRTAEVADPLGHKRGDWGYGKVHAQMGLGRCGEVIAATYWGSRRNLVIGGSYQGDHLLRYDPSTSEITSLGVPVPGFGVPSLAVSADGRTAFGEAVDPDSQPNAGSFFAADTETGEVVFRSDDDRHVGFRSILMGADGAAHFSAGNGQLFRYEPGADELTVAEGQLPGEWLRAATSVAPNGSVYGVTRGPDHLFEMTADGEIIDMGPTDGYVTSVALSPDGTMLYYMPDAHGRAWTNGAPLIAVDTATGAREVVVELHPLIERELGVRAGGTYNVAIDPQNGRIFVGLNASAEGSDDLEATFGSVVLVVIDLE